jgi:hypothetical protein
VRPDLVERRRVLDFVLDDVKRLQGRLAGFERQKLDEYLTSIDIAQKRAIEAASFTPAAGCAPKTPGELPSDPPPEDVFAAQMDLGLTALTCGLTNVLTVSFLGDGWAFRNLFPEQGPKGAWLHNQIGHRSPLPGHAARQRGRGAQSERPLHALPDPARRTGAARAR